MTEAERRLTLHRQRIAPALLALLAGLLCFVAPRVDRTLGQPLRAHGGDVALAAFLLLGAGVFGSASRRLRATVVLVVLFAIELSQLVRSIPRGGLLVELTLGSTFDPFDLVAYAAGTAIAWALDDGGLRPPSPRRARLATLRSASLEVRADRRAPSRSARG